MFQNKCLIYTASDHYAGTKSVLAHQVTWLVNLYFMHSIVSLSKNILQDSLKYILDVLQ